MKIWLLTSAALTLAACGGSGVDAPEDSASDDMTNEVMTMPDTTIASDVASESDMMSRSFAVINAAGAEIGEVRITDQASGGVTLDLDVTAFPAGAHAIHFHTNGSCELPDFTSAGGHYNPKDVNHGFEADAPNPHAGDMRNFEAPESGVVKTQIRNERVTLSPRSGLAPLFDVDDTALIIHAGSDDYVSQPTGAAGGRIACAEITP